MSSHIIDDLATLLADTYTLYLKTQNFHWHVTGPQFHSLHQMFEQQYQELASAVDVIAERIRTLGGHAPATFKEFLTLTQLTESDSKSLAANDMVKILLEDHKKMTESIRQMIPVAQESKDEGTVDILIGRTEIHEKTSWMLRSSLG